MNCSINYLRWGVKNGQYMKQLQQKIEDQEFEGFQSIRTQHLH